MSDNLTLKGLGGWLIVVAIRLFLSCITSLFLILYSSITFIKLANLTNSIFYIENLNWIYPLEIGMNLIIIFFNIYLLYLFFTKNYKFPSLMICFELLVIVFMLLDQFITHQFTSFKIESRDLFHIAKNIILSIICISYMLNSKRVYNTFVNGHRREENYNNVIS
ncbi:MULTISPECIES: DUF2569 domain-containing protein [Gilliamella]|uniref:DUF2569 domain-containing protein n=1 Tax=Gilliamella TaxID=1193503 RepID=UPI000A3345BD|nr:MULTISPECIES: DUF2569 domain-containing protein [Gilliamella]MBI0061546.1 DUF2569 domain-containing protein [Gilliamella sp. M0320]MBI0114737.1 DUF2569 domain-containing protein [Gilliamella sp. W8123]MBI0118512.1 DUF2569 domain-containing protein [Gilliamella sp. W8129]MCT6885352.1 DUF2569 domain-containing protein [Gilliamella apis]OTQ56693.1 hypothetical protein B6D21_01650 [Gilliamella apis]